MTKPKDWESPHLKRYRERQANPHPMKDVIERFRKADLRWEDFGCDGSDECCGCCGGEYLNEDKVEQFLISELEAQKESIKTTLLDNGSKGNWRRIITQL